MEVGFEGVVGRVVRCASAGESARGAAARGAAAALRLAGDALDALADRQRLLDAHATAFSLPRPLPAAPDLPDAAEDDAPPPSPEEAALQAELEARLQQLEAGARSLRAECQENAKTLDAAEAELVKQVRARAVRDRTVPVVRRICAASSTLAEIRRASRTLCEICVNVLDVVSCEIFLR